MQPSPGHVVDLDRLAARFDARAEEGFVFDRQRGVPRTAASLSGDEKIYVGEDLVPDPERFAPLQPVDYERGLALIRGFAATDGAEHWRALRSELLQSATPFVDFERLLERNPRMHRAWCTYRDRALRAIARQWLVAHAPEWQAPAEVDGEDASLPALAAGVASDPGPLEQARRRRWHTVLVSQGIACASALLSQTPVARWLWLSWLPVVVAAVLVPLREGLQCSEGPRSGWAWVLACSQVIGGLAIAVVPVMFFVMVTADERSPAGTLNSPLLQLPLWSDPLVLPATLAVVACECYAMVRLLPRLRRDLPNFRWSNAEEPMSRGFAWLAAAVAGGVLGVMLQATWPLVPVLAGALLGVERMRLSKWTAPVLRDVPRV